MTGRLRAVAAAAFAVTLVPAGSSVAAPILAPALTAAQDTTSPVIAIEDASQKLVPAVLLTTDEDATVTLKATLDRKSAKALKLKTSLGTTTASLFVGKVKLGLAIPKSTLKKFKTRSRLTITVKAVVTDASGNATRKTVSLTLKR